MNLKKKKSLAVKVLKAGKGRISFAQSGLKEIKEAITKQDIRDLHKEGAIIVKGIKGRKKKKIKKRKRAGGKIRKKIKRRKLDYVKMTRKLRAYAAEIKKQGKLNKEETKEIRNRIRNREFRSLAHLKDYIKELRK